MTRGKYFGIGVLAASIALLASFTVQASDQQLNEEEVKMVDFVFHIQSDVGMQPVAFTDLLNKCASDYIEGLHNNGDVGTSWPAPQETTVNGVACHGLLFVDSQGATAQAAIDFWMSSSSTGAPFIKQGPYKDYDAMGVAIAHEYALILFA